MLNTTIDTRHVLVDYIKGYDRVFIAGAGRSGLVAKFFGMRLMHLGKTTYIVGETTTPKIGHADISIAVTGSGNTHSIVAMCEKALGAGATVLSITSDTTIK